MNISGFPEFVGREAVLNDIRIQVAQAGTVVVNITGPGGVGKTTLLRRVQKEYYQRPGFLVTEIIDFSRTADRVQLWVLDQIAAVQPERFSEYRAAVAEMEKLDAIDRRAQEQTVLDTFLRNYNQIADDRQRFILLFDTIEFIQETTLLNFILDQVSHLHNTVAIFAGRYNDEEAFKQRLVSVSESRPLQVALQGFDEDEARDYFLQVSQDIHDDVRQNIFLLSQGNPIKIILSLDWLERDIPLMEEITDLKPEVLRQKSAAELKELCQEFERSLMRGIQDQKSQLDDRLPRLIQYMAHFHKRFNRKMVQFFFMRNLPAEEAERQTDELLAHLKSRPFVKYLNDDFFVLHDEMIRLVRQYVWDEREDPDRSLRREISDEVCQYYQNEIAAFGNLAECSEQERITYWSYRVEAMYYRLYANFRQGYTEFENLFESLVNYRPELAALALSFLKEFKEWPDYTKLLECLVKGYYTGGILLEQARLTEAEQKLSAGEGELKAILEGMNTARRISPLDLRLLENQHNIYNQLGYCYRLMGDWKKAIEFYRHSLDLALEAVHKLDDLPAPPQERRKVLLAQIAETINNLANVYRLVGEFPRARLYCQTSILLRKTWETQHIAKSQYVMAMILWELGGTSEAMRYLREAEKACSHDDEVTWAMITKYRAYILYRAGSPEKALPLLEEVQPIFRRRGRAGDLADTLNLRCRILRDHPQVFSASSPEADHLGEAEKLALQAYEIARGRGDRFLIAECHLTLAILYDRQARQRPDQAGEYRKLAQQHLAQGQEVANDGHYHRLLSFYSGLKARIEFEQEHYEQAFYEYARQCELATQFKHAVLERSIDTLGERLRELGRKDAALAPHYAHTIREYWQDQGLEQAYPELLAEINEVTGAIEEQQRLEALNDQYQQAFRQGQWEQAAQACDQILGIASQYRDVHRATTLLDKAHALQRKGNLSAARRFAKVGLQIATDLNDKTTAGRAHLLLASILWDATNTAEAATELELAAREFEAVNDEVGKARVRRLHSYIQLRTGFSQEPFDELASVIAVFKAHNLHAELADVRNLLSRIARTLMRSDHEPQKRQQLIQEARRYNTQAMQNARTANDAYRIAESYLTQAFLEMAERRYEQVLQTCQEGTKSITPETHMLKSTFEEVRATALFEMCRNDAENTARWAAMVDSFTNSLVEATYSKPVRLVHLLDAFYERLMQMPVEPLNAAVEEIKRQWQARGLETKHSIVIEMCTQVLRYRPYVNLNNGKEASQ